MEDEGNPVRCLLHGFDARLGLGAVFQVAITMAFNARLLPPKACSYCRPSLLAAILEFSPTFCVRGYRNIFEGFLQRCRARSPVPSM
jgi:hypothetical protein